MMVGVRLRTKPRYDGKFEEMLKSLKIVKNQYFQKCPGAILPDPGYRDKHFGTNFVHKILNMLKIDFPYIFLYFPIRPVWGLARVSYIYIYVCVCM